MSHSAFNKYEKEVVENYVSSLVKHMRKNDMRDEEQIARRTRKVLDKFKSSRFLDTNPREVDGRIER